MSGFIHLNGTFNEIARNSAYSMWVEGSFNIVKANVVREGISLYFSISNVFLGNKVSTSSRSYSGFDVCHSNNNFFFKNVVSGFSSGFRLWFSSSNTIKANTVADSLTAAIDLGASYNNMVYLNNFIDNPSWTRGYVYDQYSDSNYRDAYPNMTASTNIWDNGSLGNHWGNYNGTDANGDGVGDQPYTIKHHVYDFEQGDSDFVCGQDTFPLLAQVDIDRVEIELPDWVQNIPPAPDAINPQMTEHTPTEPNSPDASPEPPQESEPEQTEPFPILLVAATVAAVAVASGAGLLFYFKKRKTPKHAILAPKNSKVLPAAQDYHCVGFDNSIHSANFLDALVDLCHTHPADDRHNVVFARNLVKRLNVRNFADVLRHFLRWAGRVRRQQRYGFGTFSYADFDGELADNACFG